MDRFVMAQWHGDTAIRHISARPMSGNANCAARLEHESQWTWLTSKEWPKFEDSAFQTKFRNWLETGVAMEHAKRLMSWKLATSTAAATNDIVNKIEHEVRDVTHLRLFLATVSAPFDVHHAPSALCKRLLQNTYDDAKNSTGLMRYLSDVLARDYTITIDALWTSPPLMDISAQVNLDDSSDTMHVVRDMMALEARQRERPTWANGTVYARDKGRSTDAEPRPPIAWMHPARAIPLQPERHTRPAWLSLPQYRMLRAIDSYYQSVLLYESFYHHITQRVDHKSLEQKHQELFKLLTFLQTMNRKLDALNALDVSDPKRQSA